MPAAQDGAGQAGTGISGTGISGTGISGTGISGTGGAVDSEFADVAVRVDTTANGPRLRLEDRRTGRVRFLDALELEAVIWLPEGHLVRLLDPSADRWRDA